MPYPDDPQSALTWNIEATCLALTEDHIESSVFSAEQFEPFYYVTESVQSLVQQIWATHPV